MPPSLAARVATIESQVQVLQELPGRIASLETRMASLETECLQFRAEVKDEFLATRHEIRGLGEGLRKMDGRLRKTEVSLRKMDGRLRKTDESLRKTIEAGDAETRRYMRVLHEEIIARIKVLGET